MDDEDFSEDKAPKIQKIIRVSPKKKSTLVLLYLLGFFLGLHAFYTGKIKKGFFYLFSISGIIFYYSYIIYYLSHHWLTSWLHFKAPTWFSIYTAFNIVIQHIPFLGWTSYFGSYLIFIFIFSLFLVLLDGLSILLGQYRDADGRKVVSQKYKKKYAQKIVEY